MTYVCATFDVFTTRLTRSQANRNIAEATHSLAALKHAAVHAGQVSMQYCLQDHCVRYTQTVTIRTPEDSLRALTCPWTGPTYMCSAYYCKN